MTHGNVDAESPAGVLALKKRSGGAKIPSSKLDETINTTTVSVRPTVPQRRPGAGGVTVPVGAAIRAARRVPPPHRTLTPPCLPPEPRHRGQRARGEEQRDSVGPARLGTGQECRNIIADVRTTGLTEATVRASIATIQEISAGRTDWFRVIGRDFDLTFDGTSPPRVRSSTGPRG